MKLIHGGKAKNDRIDAGKIARLLRGGNFPLAYVYPDGMRETRKKRCQVGFLNGAEPEGELAALRRCVLRGAPYVIRRGSSRRPRHSAGIGIAATWPTKQERGSKENQPETFASL
jgi:hypothetical protein